MFAIIKKELKQYFYSMVGFVFLAFFLAIVYLGGQFKPGNW